MTLLLAAAALALTQSTANQATVLPTSPAALRRASPDQVKHGGTFHVATGTWSPAAQRRSSGLPAGSEVVFSNTANGQGAWTVGIGSLQLPGQVTYDEGVIPTPSNFTPGFGTQPDRGIYEITGFEIKYCDFQTTPMSSSWTYRFYESFNPAGNPANLPITAAATIPLSGLPSNGCWTVIVDLSGGAEFTMRGDGAPITPDWQDDPVLDSFAYGVEYTGPLGGTAAGMFFGGDPAFTHGTMGRGAGTYYMSPDEDLSSCGTTGLGALDGFTLVAGGQTRRTPRNYDNAVACGQGSSPFGSTYLRMFAAEGPGSAVGSNYCVANPNSTGTIARMTATGSTIASSDKLNLECSGLPINSWGFFLASRTAGFSVRPAGSQGNLCLGGVVGRIDEITQVKNSGTMGETSLDTMLGEWSLASVPLGGSAAAVLPGERWHFTYWFRDVDSGVQTSNFANGLFIDFN
ncbi:MAG: hypothetical protein VX460_02425 [Planctomycetota bacterium]|nr:hypothetical protein [Planctomycetota bacterium]